MGMERHSGISNLMFNTMSRKKVSMEIPECNFTLLVVLNFFQKKIWMSNFNEKKKRK